MAGHAAEGALTPVIRGSAAPTVADDRRGNRHLRGDPEAAGRGAAPPRAITRADPWRRHNRAGAGADQDARQAVMDLCARRGAPRRRRCSSTRPTGAASMSNGGSQASPASCRPTLTGASIGSTRPVASRRRSRKPPAGRTAGEVLRPSRTGNTQAGAVLAGRTAGEQRSPAFTLPLPTKPR